MQGVWLVDLAKESSTMREILAVRKVLQSFAPKLAGLCVKWHTDKQNVARCWCWFQDVWFAKRSLAYF